jgi:exonuclease SbcD
MEQIVRIASDEEVDAVLVAGDVYDRALPPVQSVELLNRTLSSLAEIAPVILTPGNHDSATRLGFGASLFSDRLHVRSRIEHLHDPVVLHDAHGEVAVYALPYLDPDDARSRLGDDIARSHEAVTAAALDRVRDDLRGRGSPRCVVVAHSFVVGSAGRQCAQTSESERDLTVGTVDCVGAHIFDGIDYVALGHLHGRQNPHSDNSILHYSGSPLRYSFSETTQTKSVTIVDLDADGAVDLRHIDLRQPREMAQVRGTFEELLEPAGAAATHRDKWVQITVTDPVRPMDMVSRLRVAFPHYLAIKHEPDGVVALDRRGINASAMTPRDVLREFITDMGGAPPTGQEWEALEPVLAGVFGQEQ